MAIDPRQFHATFFEESLEGLDIMESNLLSLSPGEVDDETVNTIFRAAHSIKGGSGTFGFNEVAEITHVMETVLDEVREGTRQITVDLVDIILRCVDCLRGMIEALRAETDHDREKAQACQTELNALMSTPADVAAREANEAVEAGAKPIGWRIEFIPESTLYLSGNEPLWILRELGELGELEVEADLEGLPTLAELDPEESKTGWRMTLRGEVEHDAIAEVFEWVEDLCQLKIDPIVETTGDVTTGEDSTTPASEAPAPAPAEAEAKAIAADAAKATPPVAKSPATSSGGGKGGEATSIRVGTDKIDALINMVGELVITQSMLGELSTDFQPANIERLREGLDDLERHTRELQESVMRIRMLPISFAFNRFPRLVHDLSRKLDKKVELKVSGEGTELDKTVMEKIGDPLVHIVRNSLDHGIETPAVRAEAGKPEVGTLHLNAFHQGGNIVIEISDDGAGLNTERILAKACERGLASADDHLTDEQIHDLLFQPGFSTAESVSDVSGRGVGMDVVRRNIKGLGGSVEVKSRQGLGTTLTIRLPLTLAILDGQLVEVRNEVFIIPLVSIIESIQIKTENVSFVAGRAELYNIREDYIPIIRLAGLFSDDDGSPDLGGGLLVIVEGDGQKVGLVVDDLLSQQQVVIKSLETNFGKVEGLSGATILGDGTVALILDVSGVVSRNHRSGQTHSTPSAPLTESALPAPGESAEEVAIAQGESQ